MRTIRVITVATLTMAIAAALHFAQAQQAGVKRTELQRRDLGVSGT